MNDSIKGYFFGIVAAITYGMNPLFGIHLYRDGMGTPSVLFYRFFLASIMLAVYMLIRGKSFVLPKAQIAFVAAGGLLLALACMTWFMSFRVMDSGIGATIMFVYPVMVAMIMVGGFHEKLSAFIVIGIVFALAGVGVLCRPGDGAEVNLPGIVYVLISALTYAVYIVGVKVSRLKEMAPETLTFYVMLFGTLFFLMPLRMGADLQMLSNLSILKNALGVAFFPSFLSFLFMAKAIPYIGATKTAILGALEPVTAVVIGIWCFSEHFTWQLMFGIILILTSVVILICGREQTPRQGETTQ